ncbi:MAG: helix-turn-helix domain-containing protein [Streptosporangiales bacterium]
MISFEELKAKYPVDDPEEYRRAYAEAGLEGDLVELFYNVRTHAGLSHAELAERTGISEETIEDMEEFYPVPTLETFAQLSRATGVRLRLVADGVGEVDLGADRTPDDER